MKNTTLCYIRRNDEYLLLHRVKKEQDENKGKWIGVGGHVEKQESPEDCVIREVQEETGLTLTSFKYRALITFVSDTYEAEYMHLFTADGFTGELIKDCNEGELAWVKKDEMIKLPMWEGDLKFLPLIMDENKRFFTMKLTYKGDKLVDCKVAEY